MRRRGVCLAISVTVALATVRGVCAGEPEIPGGVGPLPDFTKGARGGALVSAQHIQSYRGVLPKEIADLVEQGEFSFEAVRSPREPLRFVRASGVASQSITLGAQGELQGLSATALPTVVFPPGESIEGDAKEFSAKVLWNAAAATWRFKAFATQLSMYIFQKPDAEPHKLEFLVERVHPLSLGTAPGTLRPVFREKVSARKPAAIHSLAWLTLRFFGPGEDFVWVASPVNRRIRQITGSNRSDSIFAGAFATDDLFVWSGKPELVEPVFVSQVPLLVPLLEVKEPPPTQQDGCFTRDLAGGAALNLNSQARRFQGAAGWVPANTLMTLRNVLRIEVTSRDPFSLDTRQVIYVDQSTGIPVYRMVWDQSGRLRKIALGVLRSLEGQPEESGPIIAGVILVHVNDGRRFALISDTFTNCNQYVPGRMLEDFDPSSFVRFEQPATVQKKLEATAIPEDSQDLAEQALPVGIMCVGSGDFMSNRIERVASAGGLPGVRLSHASGYQAVVSEYGAHLLSWRDPQGHELLFVSKAAQYQVGVAIRGGMPVVFPQFGNGALPKHGFARTSMWKIVREHVPADGSISVTFRLVVKAGMYELWPHECVVELEVQLSDVLVTTLRVHNTGQTECKFFCALHTYFNIQDIDGVRVSGLQNVEYIDFLDQLRQSVESREDVVFTGPVDRVYLDSPQVVALYSDNDRRRYVITKEGFSDSVVWNPWIEGARAIADLHPQEYRSMVCVESGNVATPVVVQPGEVATSVQMLRVEGYKPSLIHF